MKVVFTLAWQALSEEEEQRKREREIIIRSSFLLLPKRPPFSSFSSSHPHPHSADRRQTSGVTLVLAGGGSKKGGEEGGGREKALHVKWSRKRRMILLEAISRPPSVSLCWLQPTSPSFPFPSCLLMWLLSAGTGERGEGREERSTAKNTQQRRKRGGR